MEKKQCFPPKIYTLDEVLYGFLGKTPHKKWHGCGVSPITPGVLAGRWALFIVIDDGSTLLDKMMALHRGHSFN